MYIQIVKNKIPVGYTETSVESLFREISESIYRKKKESLGGYNGYITLIFMLLKFRISPFFSAL